MPYSLPFPPCTLSSVCPTAAYPLPPILYVSYSYISPARCSLGILQLPIPCPMSSMCPIRCPLFVLQLPIHCPLSSMLPKATYSMPDVLYVPYTAAYPLHALLYSMCPTAAYPLHTLLYIFYSCPAVLYVS